MAGRSIPWHSQYESFTDPERQKRGCGIVALKIVMEFWNRRFASVSVDELYEAGLQLGAYLDGIGWKHAGIVAIARRYGFDGYNRDYASRSPTLKTPQQSFDLLCQELKRGPVIASTWLCLDPTSQAGHLVVLASARNGVVQVSDPYGQTESEGRREFSKGDFLRGFRQRYICVFPN